MTEKYTNTLSASLCDTEECISGLKVGYGWSATPDELRMLFVRYLVFSTDINVSDVWDAAWEILSSDVLNKKRIELGDPGTSYI